MEPYAGGDGTLTIEAAGLRFTRPWLIRKSRKTEETYLVAWEDVVSVNLVKKSIRVQVAGVDHPTSADADPYAVSLLRSKDRQTAEQLVTAAQRLCRGVAPAPSPDPAPPTGRPTVELGPGWLRAMRLTEMVLWLQLVSLLLPLALFVALVAWLIWG